MNRTQIEKQALVEILDKLKQDVLKSEKTFAAIEVSPRSERGPSTLVSIDIEISKSITDFGSCSIPTCKQPATQRSGMYPFCGKHGSCQASTISVDNQLQQLRY